MNSKSTSPLFRTKNGRIPVAMFVSPDESSLDAVLDAQKRGKIGSAFIEIVISSNDNAKSLTIAASEEIATAVVSHNYSEDSDAVQNLLELLDEHEIGMIVIDNFTCKLDDEIRRRYKGRILVVQPSLMPAFYEDGLCGVDIQKAALEYGIKVAGVTVYILGDSDSRNKIVLQKPVAVRRDETPESLDYRIRVAYGEETLPKAIDMIAVAELKKIRAYQIEKKYVN